MSIRPEPPETDFTASNSDGTSALFWRRDYLARRAQKERDLARMRKHRGVVIETSFYATADEMQTLTALVLADVEALSARDVRFVWAVGNEGPPGLVNVRLTFAL